MAEPARPPRFERARIAVEAMLGESSAFENIVIPAVVYTHPEVAWCGLTRRSQNKKLDIKVAKFYGELPAEP